MRVLTNPDGKVGKDTLAFNEDKREDNFVVEGHDAERVTLILRKTRAAVIFTKETFVTGDSLSRESMADGSGG